jgi:hypothetical protein
MAQCHHPSGDAATASRELGVAVENEGGFAGLSSNDFDLAEGDTPEAQAQRLQYRFFGGEPRCQRLGRIATLIGIRPFTLGEEPAHDRGPTPDHLTEPIHVDEIRSYPYNRRTDP